MSAPQDTNPHNGSDLPELDQLNLGDEPRLGPDGEPAPKTDEEYAQTQLTLRAIVSSKEAGVIIGKGGKNVADLRDETGVKAGVSKVVQGVYDRVLTITGGCEAISRAYAVVARALLEGAPTVGMGGVVQSNGTHRMTSPLLNVHFGDAWLTVDPAIKLLISHNQMGTIIGRQGLKIKHIQDASGVRMVAQKEMLPQSTERIVEVQGTPEGIQRAIWEICKCLVDDWQRGTGTVLYNPVVRTQGVGAPPATGGSSYVQDRVPYSGSRVTRTGNGADFSNGGARPYNRRSDSDAAARGPPTHDENGEEIQTQNISIPADMVGCIIGRAGSKISEIRKTSGARISIAKVSAGPEFPAYNSAPCLTRSDRRLMMRRVSACSPSWALPRPTRRRFSSSTRISKRRRCAASNRLPRRPSRARTKTGGATGCRKRAPKKSAVCCNRWSWASGILTNCPDRPSRRLPGLGWIWRPLAKGHQPDLTAARRCYSMGERCDDHISLTQKSIPPGSSLFFPFSWTGFSPHPTLFIRRRSTDRLPNKLQTIR